MKRLFAGVLLLVLSASVATAQPFTRRSSQEKHDGLKQYYEVANFKLGGKYDLANPSKWENGGEGGVTLEFSVARAGRYRVRLLATAGPDFAIVRVVLAGQPHLAELAGRPVQQPAVPRFQARHKPRVAVA